MIPYTGTTKHAERVTDRSTKHKGPALVQYSWDGFHPNEAPMYQQFQQDREGYLVSVAPDNWPQELR